MHGELQGEISARHRIADLQVQDVIAPSETEMRDRLPVDAERRAEINVCADTEPTTGAPTPRKPWWIRQARWLRHVAAVTIIFLAMWVTFILALAVVHESINPILAVFLGMVYGGAAGFGIYWLEGE